MATDEELELLGPELERLAVEQLALQPPRPVVTDEELELLGAFLERTAWELLALQPARPVVVLPEQELLGPGPGQQELERARLAPPLLARELALEQQQHFVDWDQAQRFDHWACAPQKRAPHSVVLERVVEREPAYERQSDCHFHR